MPWDNPHPSTGDAIAICNGANVGHCTEADEVVKHRLRRTLTIDNLYYKDKVREF